MTPEKKILLIILAGAAMLRISLAFLLPVGPKGAYHLEGLNDEPSHFNYVEYLAVNRSFPVLTHWVQDSGAFVRNEFEYHQAPLYYLLCVPFYRVFGEKGAIIPCRLLNVLFGVLFVWVLALMMRDLGCPERARYGAAIFTGLLFSHSYFTSVVSNDALSWLLALVLTRGLLRYVTGDGPGAGKAGSLAAMTLCCAAGLWTKSSFLLLLPVVFGAFAYKAYRTRTAGCIVHGLLVAGVSCLLALPWYVRNVLLYHSVTGMPAPSAAVGFSVSAIGGFIKGAIIYFWFPMQNLEGGTIAFAALTLCGAAILALHCVWALYWMAGKGNRTDAAIVLAVLLFINAVAAFRYYLAWQNPEARFLFPALGAMVFFIAVPAYQIFKRVRIGRLFIPYSVLLGLFPYLFLVFAK